MVCLDIGLKLSYFECNLVATECDVHPGLRFVAAELNGAEGGLCGLNLRKHRRGRDGADGSLRLCSCATVRV